MRGSPVARCLRHRETPGADVDFYALMALIGLYVGVIPVAIGMLWLPWVRGVDPRWIQFLLAFTIGLLAFLGIEALLEGTDIAGAGADGLTQRWNRDAFDQLRLAGRVLADMTQASTASTLFGLPLPHPIVIAPVAHQKLAHPDGELATVLGASASATWMTISTLSSVSIEEIARNTNTGASPVTRYVRVVYYSGGAGSYTLQVER